MKKAFPIFLAVAFAFSMAGVAVAADNAVKPMKAAEKPAAAAEKAAAPAEKSVPAAVKPTKAKAQLVSGVIESLDAAAGTFTVKGRKGNVDLKAGGKVKLETFKVGDKVVVKYADGTASSMKAVKAAKKSAASAEKAAASAEKSAADAVKKPAPAAAPAPAAVPAEKK